jgi:hypothetical protein
MAATGELTSWTVALLGGGSEGGRHTFHWWASLIDAMTKRGGRQGHCTDRYAIGRLLSPRDEAIDLDGNRMERLRWHEDQEDVQSRRRAAKRRRQTQHEPEVPNGPSIRHHPRQGFRVRRNVAPAPQRGLLLALPARPPTSQAAECSPDRTDPVMAFGVSFPASDSGVKVEYAVDHLLWTQEYGPAD